jgi:outer membrane protein OmpA-like peptidoglycan-associated protein
MPHRVATRTSFLSIVVFAALALVPPSHAGFGDALKQKLKEKAGKKADQAVDKGVEKAEQAASGKPATASTSADGAATGAATSSTPGGAAADTTTKVAAVSTKFDYVPGDKVILLDDFTQDDLGEFPVRFKPIIGTFEVAESAGERWLRCVSPDGTVELKLPEAPQLPEYWTLEFDAYGTEPMENAFTVKAVSKADEVVWEAVYPSGPNMSFRTGAFLSAAPLDGVSSPEGRHHFMFMARQKGLKAYIDRQRLVNMPEIDTKDGPPTKLQLRLWASTKPMITNLRYAEGCKPAQDLLAQGKLVTYGIHFATGSDVVLADSAPILRQIAAWLKANPTAKLTITGHTDNVGTAPSNLDLSKRRAAAVARVLSDQFAIAADRLASQGKGDTQAVADNSKPEGRAMNRRVEFAKL